MFHPSTLTNIPSEGRTGNYVVTGFGGKISKRNQCNFYCMSRCFVVGLEMFRRVIK